MTRSHALLGGSSADRWSNCTGSVYLKKDLPAKPPSEASMLGTEAHDLLEKGLQAFLKYKLEGVPYVIEHDKPEVLEVVLNTIDVIWDNVLFGSITDKVYGMETKFTVDPSLDMYGYTDFWCVYIDDKGKRVGVIFDFKYGFHSVDVDKNAQLAFYAVALLQMLEAKGKSLDYVRGIIYQPRIYGENPYKETKFTHKQLLSWKEKFLKAGNDILVSKQYKYKTGTWCKFCEAQSICKAYKKDLSKHSSLALLDTPIVIDDDFFPAPEKIPDEEISKIVLNGETIKKFIDSCKTYALSRALNGDPIPGTKAVEGSSRRVWGDNEKEIEVYLKDHGVDDIYHKKLKGITLIEKDLAKLHGRSQAKIILDKVVVQSVPSVSLVSEQDERIAVKKVTFNDTGIIDE